VLHLVFTALLLGAATLAAQSSTIPPGFKSIFNGKDLSGWHISTDTHHGNSQAWRVENGVLSGGQDGPGNGGLLLTNRKYRDVEVYLEIRPDWGCDGGLFFRSNEKGQSYQVQINYLPKGEIGGISGEGLAPDGRTVALNKAPDWEKHWKKHDWNALRALIEGNPPHLVVWLNGAKVNDWTDSTNRAIGGAEDGMIALQVHGSKGSWIPGGLHRFRNIAVKEH